MKKAWFFVVFVMLFCAVVSASAQDKPKIAVYVTNKVTDEEVKEAFNTLMLDALVNSGRYVAIERSDVFLAELDNELAKQHTTSEIDESQIVALGKKFGAEFVCIANISKVLGAFMVSARIVDVKTAVVSISGKTTANTLGSLDDLTRASDQVVKAMFTTSAGQKAEMKRAESKVRDELDFTSAQRWQAFGLNVIPGLGSMVIMKDYVGGGVQLGIVAVGSLIMGVANTDEEYGLDFGTSFAMSFLSMDILNFIIINPIRTFTCHSPAYKNHIKNTAFRPDNFRFAVFPDKNGDLKTVVVYRQSF